MDELGEIMGCLKVRAQAPRGGEQNATQASTQRAIVCPKWCERGDKASTCFLVVLLLVLLVVIDQYHPLQMTIASVSVQRLPLAGSWPRLMYSE